MQVTINLKIDDRFINFFRKVFTKRKAVLALLVAALATNLNADSITKLNTFRGGDTIIASQVNDNFDQLFTKVNDLDAQVTTLEGFGHWSAFSGGVYYNSGNVGIGDPNPKRKLDVAQSESSNNILGLISSASIPYGMFISFSAASPDNNTNHFQRFSDSTTDRAILYSDGDWANHDGAYGTISDKRFKDKIRNSPNQLGKITQVKVRDYEKYDTTDKKGAGKKRTGFIAQELELIYPELVSEISWNNETVKAVKTTNFIPLLVKAIQEQQEIINNLKARIEALEAPIIAKSRSNTSIKTGK